MKLDVAAGEKTRGDNHGGADAVFFELQAKAVDADTGFAAVVGSGAEINRAEEVGIRGAADIAISRRIAAAIDARVKVAGDLRAADVQASKEAGGVVVDEIEMAEVAAVFASGDQSKIGVIALVGDDEAAAGGEITGGGLHVCGYNGSVLDAQNKK